MSLYQFSHLRETSTIVERSGLVFEPTSRKNTHFRWYDVIDHDHIKRGVENERSWEILLRRLIAAGYFRSPDGLTLYLKKQDGFDAVEYEHYDKLLIKFSVIGEILRRTTDRKTGAPVPIEHERCFSKIEGYTDLFFCKSVRFSRQAANRVLFTIAEGLPILGSHVAQGYCFDENLNSVTLSSGRYDVATKTYHTAAPAELKTFFDYYSGLDEEGQKQSVRRALKHLMGTLPVFTEDSAQLDVLLLSVMGALTRSQLPLFPFLMISSETLKSQHVGKTHIVQQLAALTQTKLATLHMDHGRFAESQFNRDLNNNLLEEDTRIFSIDNIEPAQEGEALRLPRVLSLLATDQSQTRNVSITGKGGRTVSMRRLFCVNGNALIPDHDAVRRFLFFKLSDANNGIERRSNFLGGSEEQASRFEILAALFAGFNFYKKNVWKGESAVAAHKYSSFSFAFNALHPFCCWALGLESSLVVGKAFVDIDAQIARKETPLPKLNLTMLGDREYSSTRLLELIPDLQPEDQNHNQASKWLKKNHMALGLKKRIKDGYLLYSASEVREQDDRLNDRKKEANDTSIVDCLPDNYNKTPTHISCLSSDHEDRRPSMSVYPPNNDYKNYSYHCHSCGAHYTTTIEAVKGYLGVTEAEAIDWILKNRRDSLEVEEKVEPKVEPKVCRVVESEPRSLAHSKLTEAISVPEVQEFWDKSNTFSVNDDPDEYLSRKGMLPDGFKFDLDTCSVVVPITSIETGGLISCQLIRGKEKKFLKGTKVKGGVFVYGSLAEAHARVFVCEGVATAYALHKATGEVSVACFSAGNIPTVVKHLVSRGLALTVCLEVDHVSKKTVIAVQKLSKEVNFIVPPLTYRKGDFNDVYISKGEEGVRQAIVDGNKNFELFNRGVQFSDYKNKPIFRCELGLMSYRLIEDAEDALGVLETFTDASIIGLDFETTGLSPRDGAQVRLMQVYQATKQPVVIDVFKCGGIGTFKSWLESGRCFVAHNALFEMSFLRAAGISTELDCTMLAFHSVEALQVAQDDLALELLGFDYDFVFGSKKEMQKSDWSGELSDKQLLYAATDAWVVVKLWETINRNEIVYSRMKRAQEAACQVSANGISFDESAHTRFIEDKQSELESKRQKLLELLPGLFDSDNKMKIAILSKYLSQVEGWPLTEKTSKPCADAATIVEFKDKLDPEFFQVYSRYQKLSKFISTYGERYNVKDGRAYGSFNLCGTKTGRLSCDKSNLQNVPSRGSEGAEFRGLFKVREGKSLVVADYGQEELRILACESGEEKMLNAFRTGQDLHTLTASLVYKKPLEEVTKSERALGKTLNFGLAYGASAAKFIEVAAAAGIHLTLEEATKAKDAWFEAYDKVAKWQKKIKAQSSELKSVTAGGRIRKFIENEKIYDKERKRYKPNPFSTPYVGSFKPDYYSVNEAYNTPIQGGGADVLLEAMAELPALMAKYGAKLVNLVHDEVVVEVDEDKAETLRPELEKLMVDACLRIYPEMPTLGLVDAGVCSNWGEK